MNFQIDPGHLKLAKEQLQAVSNAQPNVTRRTSIPRHKPGEHFIRGPIPLAWLSKAASLPGRAIHLGLAIWYGSGLKKSASVAVSRKWINSFGMNRYAAYRALNVLEKAGLISVIRHRGRKPLVTLLEVSAEVPEPDEILGPTWQSTEPSWRTTNE